MKVNIIIPNMGESVAEATVSEIIKPSQTVVQQEEEILELETDKINQVLYAPASGQLFLTISKGDRVTPLQEIGCIETEVDAPVSPPSPPPQTDPLELPKQESPLPSPPASENKEKGIRKSTEDYLASLEKNPKCHLEKTDPPDIAPPPSPKKGNRKPMSTLRRTLAKRLVEVKNATAMLTTFNEVDMSSIIEIRSREKERFMKKHTVKLGFLSFFVKACCVALKEFPEVNAYIEEEDIVYPETINMGISVSTPKGLIVPVLKQAETLSFASIEREVARLAQKAREGTLSIDDLKEGTFTITNGGVFGSMLSTPILNPPQSAILGMHNIIKRPVVIDDQITIRPIMYLALTYDHRIIDGREAVTFLVHIKEFLEKPERLLLGEVND